MRSPVPGDFSMCPRHLNSGRQDRMTDTLLSGPASQPHKYALLCGKYLLYLKKKISIKISYSMNCLLFKLEVSLQ